MTKDSEGTSKVITGKPVKDHKVKTMLVDDNGIDIEQMQEVIKKQSKIIDNLSAIVEARDAEDAEITRKLIVSKTKRWNTPFTYDELVEFSKDDLDDLHKFVARVGRKDLREEIDEAPEKTVYKAVRKFPKLSSQDNATSYKSVDKHTFNLS